MSPKIGWSFGPDDALTAAPDASPSEPGEHDDCDDPHCASLGPSEPVPSTPRVWAMPEIPEDVKTLRDTRDSNTWVRAEWENHPSDPAEYWTDGQALISLGHLLQTRGPLTEVEETNDAD